MDQNEKESFFDDKDIDLLRTIEVFNKEYLSQIKRE